MENFKESFVYKLIKNVNKQEVKPAVNTIISAVEDGEIDVLEVYAALKKVEKLVDTTIGSKGNKHLKENALNAVREYGKDNTDCNIYNANFVATSVYTFYNYAVCDDPIWNSLKDVKGKVEELMKAREAELKAYTDSQSGKLTLNKKTEVIENIYALEVCDFGEEVQIKPAVKISRDGVKVTVK